MVEADHALMSTYPRLPVAFTHGEGAWLWDEAGNRYLDALCGLAVTGLGHAHPAVTTAVAEQSQRLLHTSNLYRIPVQEQLGERLCALTGQEKVFFCNSGAEANEAALKIARLYGHQHGIDAPTVVVMEGAFHGRTMATLTATGNPKVQAGFEPLLSGFMRVPYNDAAALRDLRAERTDIVAVLLEPVQGEAGIVVPDPDYLRQVREICDARGWLMMIDEIQSGMGRSGKWLASEHAGVSADVVTLAKALGNGVPIGACLARGEAANVMQAGHHGSTFGGNPLACSAALAVLDTIESENLLDNAAQMGEVIVTRLREKLAGVNGIREIRSLGLLLGIELQLPCPELVQRALDRGLLINVAQGNVIRLLPPLIIDREQAGQIADILAVLVREFLSDAEPAT
ncbi:MAG: acetylornithine transaminase [Gammaproteobacteria bacterium]|nr:acetylornithine transaminase [Gammaproteobacteria bacterium]